MYIICAICKKKIRKIETEKWCYHQSFPGPVCRNHHGVEEEYDRLFKEACDKLVSENMDYKRI